jgi:hypothetical protein
MKIASTEMEKPDTAKMLFEECVRSVQRSAPPRLEGSV